MEQIRFPFLRPRIPPPERWTPYLDQSYSSARYTNFGPVNRLFQQRLERFVGIADRKAISAASATAALTAVIMALDIRGKVAVPAFTFPATVHAVLMAGCVPVLCDVDLGTWELSPETLALLLLRHDIAAVMHVRAFGLGRDLAAVEGVCDGAGIPLIVDAAAALGGTLPSGTMVGGQGIAEVFSLHATKVLGIGEGGVVLCDKDLAERIARVLNFGLQNIRFTRAMNGKLSDFSAAVALAALDAADESLQGRAEAAHRYETFFRRYSGFVTAIAPGLPPWQCFPVLFPAGASVPQVIASARCQGLELRRYYHPALHRIVPAEFAIAEPMTVSEQLADRMVCFPVYHRTWERDLPEILAISSSVLAQCDRNH